MWSIMIEERKKASVGLEREEEEKFHLFESFVPFSKKLFFIEWLSRELNVELSWSLFFSLFPDDYDGKELLPTDRPTSNGMERQPGESTSKSFAEIFASFVPTVDTPRLISTQEKRFATVKLEFTSLNVMTRIRWVKFWRSQCQVSTLWISASGFRFVLSAVFLPRN